MYLRTITLALLASASLTAVGHAQTATAPVPDPSATPAEAKPATTPAPATSAPANKPAKPAAKPSSAAAAPTTNIGEIQAKEAPKPRSFSQTGMTASPTDFAEVQNKADADKKPTDGSKKMNGIGSTPRPVSTGGVTGMDLGGGYMINEEAKKSRSTVTRDAIDKQSPTANPYQMINLLPGVVQSSVDDTGLNGGNIRLRGFNSDHVGMTIEGMPVNDSGNYALYPQEYVDAANMQQVSIAQGSPDLDSPHIGSVGGVINLYMRDPSKTPGGLVEMTFGSDDLMREYVRAESGQVGNVRAYMSYSHLTKDHWVGPGDDERHHADFKAVWDIDKDNTVRVSAIYNEAVNTFYVAPTLNQFNTGNYTWKTTPYDLNYYGYRLNPFKNLILSAPSNFKLSENLRFDTVPYYWYGYGSGGGATNLKESAFYYGNLKVSGDLNGNGVIDASDVWFYNPSITETHRPGVINKLTYTLGDHKVVAGHWFEYAHHRQTGTLSNLDANGNVVDEFANDAHVNMPAGATCVINKTGASGSGSTGGTVVPCPEGELNKRNVLTETTTNMFFVGDTWKFNSWLTFDYGVKHVIISRDIKNYMPDAKPPYSAIDDEVTLPTAGVKVQLDRDSHVFANVATSFRSAPNYTAYADYNMYSSTGYTPAGGVDPESSLSWELGHRYQGNMLATSVTAFLADFEDYQQRTNIDDGGSSKSVTQNIGRVRNYGIDAEIGTAPIYNFRPYASFEYLRAELRDDLRTRADNGTMDYLPTAGKTLPGAPEFQFGLGLDYDDGHLFGNLAYKYLAAQYSTLMNDEEIDGYGRLNASIGYRFSDIGYMKAPEVKLSLFNVLDSHQLTGVYGEQNNAKATTGVNGNAIKASGTPTYYLGQDFSALVTFRSGF
jgi:iron complex outermembrane receptor protein